MANPGHDTGEVAVALTGDVYVAPEDTPAPALAAIASEPASPWVGLGYIGEDGATLTTDRDVENIDAWNSPDPVRVLVTSEPKTVAFEMLQWNAETFRLAMGGGSITGGVFTFPSGERDVRAMLVRAVDGDVHYVWHFPRVSISGSVETQLVRTDAMRLPVEFAVLASAAGVTMTTDAPAADWPDTVAALTASEQTAELELEGAGAGSRRKGDTS